MRSRPPTSATTASDRPHALAAREFCAAFASHTTSRLAGQILNDAMRAVDEDRCYDALKLVRRIILHEDAVLKGDARRSPPGGSLMSGAIGISSYSTLDQLLASANSLNTQYATLQEQTTTGLVSQSYSGLASVSSQVMDLTAAINQGNAYTQNITQAQGQASAMQNVLSQLGTMVSNMASSALTISPSSPGSTVTSLAQQASDDLSQVAALLNTTYEGNYVFSGADTANPPITSPDGLTSSSMFTNIGSLVSAFAAGSGTTSASAVISNASSIMATGTIFSPYLTAAATTPVAPATGGDRAVRVCHRGPARDPERRRGVRSVRHGQCDHRHPGQSCGDRQQYERDGLQFQLHDADAECFDDADLRREHAGAGKRLYRPVAGHHDRGRQFAVLGTDRADHPALRV